MSQFSLSFFLSLIVAFFAPMGMAASDIKDTRLDTAGTTWQSSSYNHFLAISHEPSSRLANKLNQRQSKPNKPTRPTSNSFGEHDAQGILSSWRWIGGGHESREQETPHYTQVADFGAPCYLEQFAVNGTTRLLTPFYFRYASSQHRLSGWKDGNTLYVYLNSLYA
ncbi:hypothetical protein [Vibrio maritimus]|uniref:hypothetical protein n=1 Tax=Vibrio maritimus TaxID=990268 RepID=UPI0037361A92